MRYRHLWASAFLLLNALTWGLSLLAEPAPWEKTTAVVLGTAMVIISTVSVAGILVEGNRLAYSIGFGNLGLTLAVAAIRPIDLWWMIGLALSASTGVLMADHRLGGWLRVERPAAPVPPGAVALALLLLVGPAITAFSLVERASGAIAWLSLMAWLLGVWYLRRLPGAVALIRLAVPLLGIGAFFLQPPGRWIWVLVTAGAAGLAWKKSVRLAVRPLVERGTRVSIPPELLSDEVRRATGIDQSPPR